MDELLADMADAAGGGHAVIADATFLDPVQRERVAQVARDSGLPFAGIWLDAPLPVLESRLEARANDASDATVEVLRRAYRTKSGWRGLDNGGRERCGGGARAGAGDRARPPREVIRIADRFQK